MQARAIVSRLTNPFHNLAIETNLFKHKPSSQKLLFIYFNEPCIVIGRNQNPWAECNLLTNLPILRRRSGGGTVVHDLQNANFCVQFPRVEFSRTKHLQMIVDAFPHLNLSINERNDLVQNARKVSGSSYKIEKDRAYHHATLLLNSDLQKFDGLLDPQPSLRGKIVKNGGTESVKSPISNTHLSPNEFVQGAVSLFREMYGDCELEEATSSWVDSEVEAEARELQSWEWVFGKTPKFQIEANEGNAFEVVKGRVAGTKLPADFDRFLQSV